ncbi:DUF563 domain-containing protein [Roseococcus sp. SYP-B2431]|uniref:glycosyltransferase family 61 protein n=1 Tax=Roseococcus sp. SYP-B2431 TaxID=2496640 RepID=UPI0013F3F859|nr:glycosyltransferase family 61 protein [Roseococcus sp. SYP-B2431]
MPDFQEIIAAETSSERSGPAAWSRTVTSRNFASLRPLGRVRRIGPQPAGQEAGRPAASNPVASNPVALNPVDWGGTVGAIPDEYVVFENVFVTRMGAVVEGNDFFMEDMLFRKKDSGDLGPEWMQRYLRDYGATPTADGTEISSHKPPVKKSGTYFLLTHGHTRNFGHFVHDVLPRFHIFDHLPEELRRGATLLAGHHPLPMQQALLEAFRGDHPIATISPGLVWQIERVVMPRNPMSSVAVSVPALRHARERMQRIAGSDRPPASRRPVYIARPNPPAPDPRRLDNLPALEALLDEYGFVRMHCETLSPREQMELFRGTSVLIGLHGAGMMNQLFLPGDATVIEITARPRKPRPRRPNGMPMSPSWIITLSQLLGLGGYYSIPEWRDEEAHVDIATLRDFLDYLREEGKLG